MMAMSRYRTFSTSVAHLKSLRFAETIKEASKPPLTESIKVSKPFGVERGTVLNHKSSGFGGLTHELFSSEAKERRQKRLDHDIAHSPFYESKSFNNTKGKIFTPPISFFRSDKSKYFPDFSSSTLTKKSQLFYELLQNKISFVRIYSTVSGEKCADSYFDRDGKNYLKQDYTEMVERYPHAQMIDINIPQSFVKGLFVKLAESNLRAQLPNERHNLYYIVPESLFPYDIKQKLLCDNTCSGYIYLVDHQGRIRWATSGSANDSEVELMWKCLKGLEKEYALLSQ